MATVEFDIGEVAVIELEFEDPITGLPVDPAAIALTIEDPDGNEQTFTRAADQVVKVSDGHWRANCDVCDKAGTFYTRTVTTDPKGAREGKFKVRASKVLAPD